MAKKYQQLLTILTSPGRETPSEHGEKGPQFRSEMCLAGQPRCILFRLSRFLCTPYPVEGSQTRQFDAGSNHHHHQIWASCWSSITTESLQSGSPVLISYLSVLSSESFLDHTGVGLCRRGFSSVEFRDAPFSSHEKVVVSIDRLRGPRSLC